MRPKNYLTAREVEAKLNERRNEEGLTDKTEKRIVKTLVQNAIDNNRTGDSIHMIVEPFYIHTPEWQRDLNITKAMRIGNHFEPVLWDDPKVIYINGILMVIDGNHRVYGTCFSGKEKINVRLITDITMKEAIQIFLDQSKNRKSISPADGFSAAITAEIPEYLKMKEICDKHHVQIKGDINPIDNPVGFFTSVNDGVTMAKSNPALLDRILSLLGKLQWNLGSGIYEGKAYNAKVFRSLKLLYAYHSGNEKQLEDILLSNCKGSAYFNEHLAKKWQDSLFDHLATVVENGMKTVQFKPETSGKRGKMII